MTSDEKSRSAVFDRGNVTDPFQIKFAETQRQLRTFYEQTQKDLAEAEKHPQQVAAIASYKRYLAELADQLEILRPSSDKDIAYRKRVLEELPKLIEDSVPPSIPLRFHGTPLYYAEDIISSGTITDASGQISVTTPHTVERTLAGHTDMLKESCTIPTGCIFVLLPASPQDAESGESMFMENVDFNKDPQRLFGVLTSAENVSRVREWMEKTHQDPNKVMEFFEFPQRMRELQKQL